MTPIRFSPSSLKEGRWYEYLIRFVLGGAATVFTGLVSSRYGAFIGGLFLALPAIFCASATLIEKHEIRRKREAGLVGERRGQMAAAVDAAGAALGALGMLAFAVAFEHFKFVAGRNHQIFQPNSRIEQSQLGQGRLLDIAWQPARVFAIPDLFGFTVAKACDHATISYSCEYIRQENTLQIV